MCCLYLAALAGIALQGVQCLPDATYVTLNNGVKMPVISLGTAEYNGKELEDLISTAVREGFRGIDTAFNYYNQASVGKGLKKVNRTSLFVVTKTTPCFHPQAPPRYNISDQEKCAEQTRRDVESNFDQLDVDTIDLLLLHGPNHFGDGACDEKACLLNSVQWAVYEDFLKSNRVRAIGVSNYCPSCLACIMGKGRAVPAVNQIKYHAGMTADPQGILSYSEHHGIIPMAYSPLGSSSSSILRDPYLQAIADKHNKSIAQIGLKWIQSKGYTFATASSKASHLQEDLDLFAWSLSADEIAGIDTYSHGNDKASWGCSDPASDIVV